MTLRGWASATGVVLAALALTLALSACGGEGGAEPGSAASSASADRREGALEFAECMREHGVDHPDPDENGLFRIEPGQSFDPRSAQFRQASEACEKYLRAMGPPPKLSEEDREKLQEQMLSFAECMRRQGVDMPDPQFDGEGRGFTFRIDPGGIDPNDPKFREAEQTCRQYSPELNPPEGMGG